LDLRELHHFDFGMHHREDDIEGCDGAFFVPTV